MTFNFIQFETFNLNGLFEFKVVELNQIWFLILIKYLMHFLISLYKLYFYFEIFNGSRTDFWCLAYFLRKRKIRRNFFNFILLLRRLRTLAGIFLFKSRGLKLRKIHLVLIWCIELEHISKRLLIMEIR